MNLQHRNSHRARSEGLDALSEEHRELSIDEDMLGVSGPENRQKLKKEQWTRLIRVGEQYVGEAGIQAILPDLVAHHESPPETVNAGKKPWRLLFDPDVCDAEHADKTLEEMAFKESKIQDFALKITELREHLR